jgi:hypothetical protein
MRFRNIVYTVPIVAVLVCAVLFILPSSVHSELGPTSMTPQVDLVAPGHSEISLALDANSPGSYRTVLTNKSSRAITGLAVRWTIVDAAGNSKLSTVRSDGYGANPAFTLAGTQGQIAITPSQILPAGTQGTNPVILARPNSQLMELINAASKVIVEVDAVIFENGEIVGPNRTNQGQYILDRKAAASALVNQVRDAITNHKDVPSLLTRLTPPMQLTPDNWFLFWTGQHARRLQRSIGRLDPLLNHLASLPQPPSFFRQIA